jgi:hypothetical protein
MVSSPAVEKVLKQVESQSGKPVHIEATTKLPPNILANVRMARGGLPFHMVEYQASLGASPDYVIVYQCGFIIRRHEVDANNRQDFVATPEGEAVVGDWVATNQKPAKPPRANAIGLIHFLHSGLLSQVRSIPVGLRVDGWILQEFPDLMPLQEKALSKQLNDNASALRPDVQAAMPEQALAINLSMGAAFALFWAQRLNQPQIALPYQATGYVERGMKLLDIFNSIPTDSGQDTALIDAWADTLGMRNWYRWQKAADE